jgi:hypothetical protein
MVIRYPLLIRESFSHQLLGYLLQQHVLTQLTSFERAHELFDVLDIREMVTYRLPFTITSLQLIKEHRDCTKKEQVKEIRR